MLGVGSQPSHQLGGEPLSHVLCASEAPLSSLQASDLPSFVELPLIPAEPNLNSGGRAGLPHGTQGS